MNQPPHGPGQPVSIDPDDADSHPASVLGKANQLLAAFVEGPVSIGLTELSRRSGVPKASAHRLAVELVNLGLLARSGKSYQLGWRIFELGQLVPGPAQLKAVARPALMDLRSSTHAAVVHLAVGRGPDCVYLERLAGRREVSLIHAVGSRVPKHATASGLLFLAYADRHSRTDLDKAAVKGLGMHSQAELEECYALVRARRYSEEKRQVVPGFKTRAVPVFYPGTEHPVGSISATVRADRRDDQPVLHSLWAAAGEISRGLSAPSLQDTQGHATGQSATGCAR